MRTLRFCLVLAGAAALALGCGGDAGHPVAPPPPPPPPSGIKVIAGGSATDTIGATLTQPLTVEVRDSAGTLVAGAVVRFTAVPTKDANGATRNSTLVEALDANQFSTFAAPTADAQGRAGVLIQLGMVAGTGLVAVSVPTYGFVDTVSYTVQPGAATTLSFQPSDTGVTVGGSVKLRTAVVDRAGNPRTDPVTFDPIPGGAATIAAGGVVTGVSIGSATITAHAGSTTLSGTVEVVPKAVIAAYYGGGGAWPDSTGIVTLNLDGSNRQWVKTVGGSSVGPTAPEWMPNGDIIFTGPQSPALSTSRLFVVTPGSAPSLLNPSGTPNATAESWPGYNKATSKTFYSAYAGSEWQLFSRASDGTITQISPEGPTGLAWRSSPSPDGTKLAYVGQSGVKVYDLSAQTTSTWSVNGQLPRWSPKGDRIAYIPWYAGQISVVNPDGSNPHPLTTGYYYEEMYGWSPDGAWIVAKSTSDAIDLIDTSTGTAIHLKYLRSYYYPAWK